MTTPNNPYPPDGPSAPAGPYELQPEDFAWLNLMPAEQVLMLVAGGSEVAREYVAYCDYIHQRTLAKGSQASSGDVA